ncbi:MAG TPA: biopolymer transporter ExbD [Candidatus Pseudomonas excrementavium]|uniref:Biopolymer transport protein ExbD n=1 Tax=Halopseudomonas bauzanensis TaxID=653930 RepID=A0A031M1I6_9GAMM|nr:MULTISPECIES: biopolymer transporter ExbD [Halopseudomonas]MCO5787805.1 biopolymer transporter ExbD [Pseudomonas sp. G11-1]MCO5791029.1 biopolymer transporter ExbD [Pseudomonas sp. G11-2]HIZ51846.1 biopolymer transporter ExbD [Candidatus Pseudomonas excrementavium]EZQ13941.1 biopolymer transporter ExbD [Halopseudomonas bauzanensis]TKA89861.1 biopolymer transporter ExbD [Halopseudomonas bauzanensis]
MRMRRHSAGNDDEAGIDLTPMLDVVFIMLIFFIVTSTFIKTTGIEVNTPTADSSEQQPKGNILIAVDPNGEIWIDRQQVDIRAVRAAVERMRVDQPDSTVVVQADRDARSGLVIQVMDQVRMAGVQDVALAATAGAN